VDGNNPNYTSEGGMLFNKAKTQLLAYPSASGVVTVPAGVMDFNTAFQANKNLTSVIIPASMTSIAYAAFQFCSGLTSIIIPDSITTINIQAFQGCINLTSVTFEGIISADNFKVLNDWNPTFHGDLRDKYLAPNGGIGTYTTTTLYNPQGEWNPVWTKQ